MNKKSKSKVIKMISANMFYLTLTIFIGTIIWNSGKLYSRVNDNATEVERIRAEIDKLNEKFELFVLKINSREELKKN